MTAVPPLAAQSDVPHRNGAEQHLSRDDRRYFVADGEGGAAALLSSILDNVYQGIALFDANRRLVLFNQPYPDLLDYPDGFLQIGMSYDDILRFNAQRGERGSTADPDAYVQQRLAQALSTVPTRRVWLMPAVFRHAGSYSTP